MSDFEVLEQHKETCVAIELAQPVLAPSGSGDRKWVSQTRSCVRCRVGGLGVGVCFLWVSGGGVGVFCCGGGELDGWGWGTCGSTRPWAANIRSAYRSRCRPGQLPVLLQLLLYCYQCLQHCHSYSAVVVRRCSSTKAVKGCQRLVLTIPTPTNPPTTTQPPNMLLIFFQAIPP